MILIVGYLSDLYHECTGDYVTNYISKLDMGSHQD